MDCTNANHRRRGCWGASGREATLVFAPRRVRIQSGSNRSRRKVHQITSYVCFGWKQTSSPVFITAPSGYNPTPHPPLKIQQTPALHLAFWLTAPYFSSLLLERAEKKKNRKGKEKAQHRGKLRGKKRRHGGKHRRWRQEKRKWYNRRLAREVVFFFSRRGTGWGKKRRRHFASGERDLPYPERKQENCVFLQKSLLLPAAAVWRVFSFSHPLVFNTKVSWTFQLSCDSC